MALPAFTPDSCQISNMSFFSDLIDRWRGKLVVQAQPPADGHVTVLPAQEETYEVTQADDDASLAGMIASDFGLRSDALPALYKGPGLRSGRVSVRAALDAVKQLNTDDDRDAAAKLLQDDDWRLYREDSSNSSTAVQVFVKTDASRVQQHHTPAASMTAGRSCSSAPLTAGPTPMNTAAAAAAASAATQPTPAASNGTDSSSKKKANRHATQQWHKDTNWALVKYGLYSLLRFIYSMAEPPEMPPPKGLPAGGKHWSMCGFSQLGLHLKCLSTHKHILQLNTQHCCSSRSQKPCRGMPNTSLRCMHVLLLCSASRLNNVVKHAVPSTLMPVCLPISLPLLPCVLAEEGERIMATINERAQKVNQAILHAIAHFILSKHCMVLISGKEVQLDEATVLRYIAE